MNSNSLLLPVSKKDVIFTIDGRLKNIEALKQEIAHNKWHIGRSHLFKYAEVAKLNSLQILAEEKQLANL
jgi:hypothetical protein